MRKLGSSVLLAIVLGALLGAVIVLQAALRFNFSLPEYSQEIRAEDGRLLHLFTTSDGYWRLPMESVKPDGRFLDMLLAYEDKRFYRHAGVDVLAMGRAFGQFIVQGRVVSGASTLSMQTVRLLQPRPRTLLNKLIEIGEALALEQLLSKQRILSLYLSLAPYGGNIQGLRAASLFYFGKQPGYLDSAEAALLVALPQSPERRRPDRHPAAARTARDAVLRRLLAAGVLQQEQAEAALATPVPDKRRARPQLAPHLAQRLRGENPQLQSIDTRVDAQLQQRVETLARQHQQGLPDGQTLALLILDNRDGAIRAYLGSGDFHARRFPAQVDMLRAIRSPGSALKPFVYGMAFDAGFLHPETLVGDRPGGVDGYAPGNFDAAYQGEISVRQALQQSRNVPAVQVLRQLGPDVFFQHLNRQGADLRLPAGVAGPGLPLALGGVGITPQRLAGLYAALARRGGDGASAMERRESLMSPEAAWYVTDMLAASPRPSGYVQHGREIAFKTGTSYGFRDAWALGYDAGHTVAVWLGRPDGGYNAGISGLQTAVPLMFDVFQQLPRAGLTDILAQRPDGVLLADNHQLPDKLRRFPRKPPAPLQSPHVDAPRILYPLEESLVELSADGARVLLAEVSGGERPLYWMLDGRFVGVQDSGASFSLLPAEQGAASLSVMDARGRAHSIRFRLSWDAVQE